MRHSAVEEDLNDSRFSEVVELDDGTRLTARAAHLRDQLEASELALRQMDKVDRRWKTAGIVFAILVILAFTFLIARSYGVESTVASNSGEINNLKAQVVQLQADGNALEKQVRSLGQQPVATVPPPQAGPPGVPGATGATGQPGETPSDEKLLGLIRTVIAEHPPKDGHTPTAEELLAIIKPLIPAAVPGPQGAPGETPSDERLLALIKPLIPAPVPGPKGEPGETGPQGSQGERGTPGPTCPDGFALVEHQDTDVMGEPVGPKYIRCEQQ